MSECGKETEHSLLEDLIEKSKSKELNFSIDSGMEDPVLSQGQSASDDSDDEIVCRRKVKKKAILDDDDDEDADVHDTDDVGVDAEMETKDSSDSGENKENIPTGDADVEDDDDDDDLRLNLEMENSDVAHGEKDESDNDDVPVEASANTLQMELKDNDLFDAESDDEQRPALTDDDDSENSTHQGDNEGGSDEGFDESQINPALLAKLKKLKGAAKTPKQKEKLHRKSKPTAEQMTELYSESQRMLRDSRVNLPYYEPETKLLDDFLARATKKRQEYSVLSKPKDFQKALIIQEKLSVTPPMQITRQKDSKLSLKSKEAKSGSQETSAVSGSALLPSESDTQAVTSEPDSVVVSLLDSGVESQELALSQSSTVILSDNVPNPGCTNVPIQSNESVDIEELPEIKSVPSQIDSATNVQGEEMERPIDTNAVNSQISRVSGKEKISSEELAEVVSLQKDPSRDLFVSMNTEEQFEESFRKVMKDVEEHDLCVETDSGVGNRDSDNKSLGEVNPTCTTVPESLEVDDDNSDDDRLNAEEDEDGSLNREECKEILNDKDDTEKDKDKLEVNDNSPNSKPNKLSLLERLEQQGLVVEPLPKLSGSPDSVINLDNEAPSKSPRNVGVLKLMDRLVQHQTKKKPHASYDVNLSIIEKEGFEGEQKELKLKSMTYHVEEEKEELPSTAPGARLAILKEKLGVGMKMKREEARLRRQQMFNLENEEGFEGKLQSDDEEQEEEAEMTDDEYSSDEEEEGGIIGMVDGSDDGEDYNPLLDTEAKDSEDEEDLFGMDESSNDVKLRFEVSDEEEEDDDNNGGDKKEKDDDDDDQLDATQQLDDEEDENTPVKGKKKLHHRFLSDDEDDSNIVKKPSVQEKYHHSDAESLPEFELTPLTRHFQDTQYPRDSSRSPELYAPSLFEESSSSNRPGDNLNDSGSNYNPHSQMLDADGYLKVTQTQRPPKSRISLLVDCPEPEDNAIMDGFESSCKMSAGKIFEGMSGRIDSQTGNMSELLGLCSGTFQQNSLSEDAINPSQNRRYEEDESELSNPFRIVDAQEEDGDTNTAGKRKRIKPVLSDSEDEREADTDIEDSDDESSHLFGPGKFKGFKDKITKGIRKDFLEDEAELSGSEFDSDENLDLAEEDDILEEEEGDREMAGVSEEELRNQVGKVHMKQLLDDDDKAVMRYKEMYLQDGDLYSDGNGRMRHFRWKDAGDLSQQDMFQHQSDEEQVEEDAEEIKWRKERIEREKFIEESQQGPEESSKELQKYGQLFVKRSDSTSSLHKTPSLQQKPSASKKPSMKKKGSFLSRGKAALVQFANIAKTALGGNSKQNSRSFVFQSKENQEEEEKVEEVETMPQPMHPPKRKAHSVPSGNTPQAAKKPRLSTSTTPAPPPSKQPGSIFNLLNK